MRLVFGFLMLAMLALSWAQSSTSFIFSDVSEGAGITATHRAVWEPDTTKEGYLAIGQAWADYNNDGWID
jgi:hypothetical protein